MDLQDESAQADLAALQEQVLSWMVDEVLIDQYAAQAGIKVTAAQLQTELNRMRGSDQARFDEWLSANGMTLASLQEQLRTDLLTAAVRDQVTNNVSRRASQVYIRHILLSDDVTADKVLQELEGGANFIATARQYSEDKATSENGGDWVGCPAACSPRCSKRWPSPCSPVKSAALSRRILACTSSRS
jgi:parvulin-like peptidyl-prolyl isomerase